MIYEIHIKFINKYPRQQIILVLEKIIIRQNMEYEMNEVISILTE